MTEPFPSRPRYMHRRTYQCLRRRYEAAVEQYVGAMEQYARRYAVATSRE